MSSSNCCFVTCVQISQEAGKALPKARLAPKKVMVTVWWSAASLIHYSFLNPGETSTSEKYTQQIGEMHQKLQCQQLALVNRKNPVLLHDNTCHTQKTSALKAEWIGLQSITSSAIFSWPLANWLPLLESSWWLFAGRMLLQPTGYWKCLPRVHRNPEHRFLHFRNKHTYFWLAKMCWL